VPTSKINVFDSLKSDSRTVVTPAEQLTQYGEELRQATTQELDYQIVRDTEFGDDSQLILTFYIVAPTLKDYRFKLLEVRHRASPYPLNLSRFNNDANVTVKDEASFRTHLLLFFRSKSVREALTGILAQATAESKLKKSDRYRLT
jgi:hypothetical protein